MLATTLLSFWGTTLLFSAVVTLADGNDSKPAHLLARLAGISRLYSDTALRFTCSERITANPGGTHRFEYIYVHGPDGQLADYRTRSGSSSGRPIDVAAMRLPRWLSQAYCWAFIFGPTRWNLYHFELQGEAEVLGRPAFKIRFEPSGPAENSLNDWYGTAWIDRQTLQLLRVEAQTPESFYQRRAFEKKLALLSAAPTESARDSFEIETITTDFAIEKNGMRFPSAVLIEKVHYRVPALHGRPFSEALVYRVRQSYSDYRFFSVRSNEEIRSILSGEPAGTGQPVPSESPRP